MVKISVNLSAFQALNNFFSINYIYILLLKLYAQQFANYLSKLHCRKFQNSCGFGFEKLKFSLVPYD